MWVGPFDDSLEDVGAALDAGLNAVQLRAPGSTAADLTRRAQALRQLTHHRALLLVSRHIELAVTVGADGVQLPEDGPSVAQVRRMSPTLLAGRSVHDVAGARRAAAEGADVLIVGTLYRSPSKPEVVPAGLGLLDNVLAAVSVPIVGIGGIGLAESVDVVRRGAAGVAVQSYLASEPAVAARKLRVAMMEVLR
jgi:thiamine-phosphate pyrophosphorylase